MNMYEYQAPVDLLKDRIILVTGATDGIGRAAAKACAAHGATVILLGRSVAKLEQVYDEIEQAGWPVPAIIPMDLANADANAFQAAADAIEEEFGQLHGLLHNASILGQRAPLESYSQESWQEVMQVNVNACFGLTRYLLPLLRQSADASIILTSSAVGRQPRAYWGAYAVSKAATEAMMQVLHQELENTSNIRVNSVNPGATATAMRRKAFPAENPQTLPEPAEIMPLYLYLMGPESIGTSGQALDAQ
jgi:NAD(P)-dependent dehydrogenase (short-subunit alcohol dehydrogenase family)